MNIESIEMISITIIFVILISLATFIIDKMNWWGGVKKNTIYYVEYRLCNLYSIRNIGIFDFHSIYSNAFCKWERLNWN